MFPGANERGPRILLGLDVSILSARPQKNIKGFKSKFQYADQIRRDQRQEDQLGDYCNKIIKAEIKAEVETKERCMRHYQFNLPTNTRKGKER